jgi:hypothetical protein
VSFSGPLPVCQPPIFPNFSGAGGCSGARREAPVSAELEALPGTRLELPANLGAVLVDLAEGAARGGVIIDTCALGRDGEGAGAEVALVGAVGEVVEALASPAEQIVLGEEDATGARVAAGAAAGAVEGLAGGRIDGRIEGLGQGGIEGETRHSGVVARGGGLVNVAGEADQC